MTKNATRKPAAKKAPAKKTAAKKAPAKKAEPEVVAEAAPEPAPEPEVVAEAAPEPAPEPERPRARARRERRNAAPWPFDEPVDPSPTPEPAGRRARSCYALVTLADEVTGLFDTVTHEVDNYDVLRVALDVTFDLSSLPAGDRGDLTALLLMARTDDRVLDVTATEDRKVRVSFRSSARTQDSREPFGLAEAWAYVTADEDPEATS